VAFRLYTIKRQRLVDMRVPLCTGQIVAGPDPKSKSKSGERLRGETEEEYEKEGNAIEDEEECRR
jgi:hypothetical protein